MKTEDYLMLGAGVYFWYKLKDRIGAQETLQNLVYRTDYQPSSLSSGDVVTTVGTTTYKFGVDELMGASPFERDLLEWGVSPNVVSTISTIRSTPARVVSSLWDAIF